MVQSPSRNQNQSARVAPVISSPPPTISSPALSLLPASVNTAPRNSASKMSSTFDSHYAKLHEFLSTLKDHFQAIDETTTNLFTVSSHDEIKELVANIAHTIVDAQVTVTTYRDLTVFIEQSIKEMAKDSSKTAKSIEEQKIFDEKMDTTDGKTTLPMGVVSICSLMIEKERRYDLTLAASIKRVKSMTDLFTPTPMSVDQPSTSAPLPPPLMHTKDETTVEPSHDDKAIIADLTDRLSHLESINQSHSSSPQPSQSVHRPAITLPPMELESFDGRDITRWQSFKFQLEQLVLNHPHLTEIEKAFYVRSKLKGAAHSLVASLPVQDNFLQKIIDRLESQYGHHDLAQARLLQSLRSIRAKSSQVVDQLTAVQSMINVAHAIHDKWGVDALIVQQQVVECIHPRFIILITRNQHPSLLSALYFVESELNRELHETMTIDAFTTRHQSSVTQTTSTESKSHKTSPSTVTSYKSSVPSYPTGGKTPKNPMCVFCGKHEFSGMCTQVTTIRDRKEFLKKNSLCHCCFSSNHSPGACNRSCSVCKGKHHKSLCDKSSFKQTSAITATITAEHSIQVNTRLFTAPVVLANPDALESSMAHVLLDTGAQLSLISRSLVTRLRLSPIGQLRTHITGLMGADHTPVQPSLHDIVKFDVMTNRGRETIQAVVRDTDSIIGSIRHQPLSTADLDVIKSTLESIPSHLSESTVNPELLLGVGDTLKLLDNSKSTMLPCGYRLIQSVIGPLVVGSEDFHCASITETRPLTDSATQSFSHSLHPAFAPSLRFAAVVSTTDESLEEKVERMFSVDPIARVYETTEKEARKVADEMVTKHFDNTIQQQDDGYYVQYAMKAEAITDLPDNHDLAVSRLASTVRTLSKDKSLLAYYDSVIHDQLNLGQIEKVEPSDTSGVIHYLAHQPVLRPDKPTTPLRIVYDASAHLKNKPSLNDMIYPGPSDLEQIPALLLRARSRRGLIIADVEKAFLQVKLCPSQRNMLRFLWLKDIDKPVTQQNLLVLRFCVTPFGVNQSPCLLNKVINYHIQKSGTDCDPNLVHQLVSNLYVDNILINVDSPLHSTFSQSKHLFDSMSMNLRDYASNLSSFIDSVPESDQSKDVNQKLLGLVWNTSADQLSIKIPISVKREKESKRTMLSTVASSYDPLGLLNPLTLPSRLTVQSLWNLPLKWDEAVDEKTRDSFHEQITDLENFSMPIDRFTHLSDVDQITLVAFSDASKTSMAACVYSWVPENNPSLLISKARLAPIKSSSTIPKMELDSLAMAHSLLRFSVETLRKEFPDKPIHIYSFSDSAVVLHWCNPDFNKPVGVFVSNRVKQIHCTREDLTADSHLTYHPPRHVRSEFNPADHATRGLSSTEISDPNHQWWIGPPWLQLHPAHWPDTNLSDLQCPIIESFPIRNAPVIIAPLDTVIDLNRHSSLKKAINVTAYVYRFLTRCASKTTNANIHEKCKHIPLNTHSSLNASERRFALHSLIRHSQRSIDDHLRKKMALVEEPLTGLLRVSTRLSNSDQPADFKTPIFIPTAHDATLARLLIRDTHCSSSHAGVDIVLNSLKSKFLIPRARPLVKSTLKQCIPCRKTNNLPFRYPQSPALPSDRVKQSLPFEHCGIDYAGPFHMNDNTKQWLVVFTCFSTRLTHLDVVSSLLPSAFIFAFRRFCSRRGTPSRITSDQATTFKMASTLLSSHDDDPDVNTLFSSLGVTWNFTSAHSPWKGGIYERLIKIIKESFTRSIGQRKLSKEEFETVMCEIEALLNSRPLSYVSSDDISTFSGPVLRPIDLIQPGSFLGCHLNLMHNDDNYRPPEEENSSREAAVKQLTRSITVVDNFWKRWHQEYLSSLRDSMNKSSDPLQSSRSSTVTPQRGSIVLVIDESGTTPRSSWKMAKILSLTETAATLRSHAGRVIERPVNLLIPLEIHSHETPEASQPRVNEVEDIDAEALLNSEDYDIQSHLYEISDFIHHAKIEVLSEIDKLKSHITTEINAAIKGVVTELKKETDPISLSVSSLVNQSSVSNSQTPRSVVPRVHVPPRSSTYSRSTSSFSRNSHRPLSSRDRSRSPNHRSPTRTPRTSHAKPSTVTKTRCTFCGSSHHFTRNCNEVMSLSERLKAMSDKCCHKCFRTLDDSHVSTCQPDICKRGCLDGDNRAVRHMEWFCPQNPDLAE